MSPDLNIHYYTLQARYAIEKRDYRQASQFLHNALLIDFHSQLAWQMLHEIFGKGQDFTAFQQQFVRSVYPDRLGEIAPPQLQPAPEPPSPALPNLVTPAVAPAASELPPAPAAEPVTNAPPPIVPAPPPVVPQPPPQPEIEPLYASPAPHPPAMYQYPYRGTCSGGGLELNNLTTYSGKEKKGILTASFSHPKTHALQCQVKGVIVYGEKTGIAEYLMGTAIRSKKIDLYGPGDVYYGRLSYSETDLEYRVLGPDQQEVAKIERREMVDLLQMAAPYQDVGAMVTLPVRMNKSGAQILVEEYGDTGALSPNLQHLVLFSLLLKVQPELHISQMYQP